MSHRFLCILCGLLTAAMPASPQQEEWKDLSPHVTRFVMAEDGVQLEVLDGRGSGPPLVLLAGLGATAHYYDDFAQALTTRYRVVGVTRRGHRGSSAAPGGYGFERLAEDVLRIIDAMGLNNPVVIGHSFAGEEMHDLIRRGSSDRLPFPELVAKAADDPALRGRVEKLYLLTRERVRNHERWFEAFAEGGRVVELSGTHDLIISNPREVLEQIQTFLSSLPQKR